MKNNLTLEQLNKLVEKSNSKFATMTPAEKRVEIARDCIARLNVGQFRGNSGSICKFEGDYEYEVEQDDSIKDLLIKGVECSVCAKGGLLMAYIGRVNDFKVGSLSQDRYNFDGGVAEYNSLNTSEHVKLMELFSAQQLALIETVFENDQYLSIDENGDKIELDVCKTAKYRIRLENEHDDYLERYDSEDHEADEKLGFVRFDEDSFILLKICENIIENKGTFILY